MEIYVGIVIVVMILLFVGGKAMYSLGYKTGSVDIEKEYIKQKWH